MKLDVIKIKNAKGQELTYHGMKTTMFQPSASDKKKSYTKQQIIDEAKNMIKQLRAQGIKGQFKITSVSKGNRYWSGRFTNITDEDPELFVGHSYDDHPEPEQYDSFQFYVLKRPEQPKKPVPEKKVENKADKKAKLVGGSLCEEEEEVDFPTYSQSAEPFRVRGVADKASKIIIVRKELDSCDYYKDCVLYLHRNFDKDLLYYYKHPKSSGYLVVKVPKEDERPLNLIYDEFVKVADELITATNGKVNMYKTGSIVKTSMYHFMKFAHESERYVEPDPISIEEAKFIKGAVISSLKYAKKGTYKNCTGYDVNSFYSSILKSTFRIPVKKGQFIHLTYDGKVGKRCDYGIYRAIITGDIDPRVFRLNRLNYYTHIDMNRAMKLGYHIVYVQDGKPNYLKYTDQDLVHGNSLFGEYVSYFYNLKSKGVGGAKLLLNCLWGWLVRKTTMRLTQDGSFDIGMDKEIIDLYVDNDGQLHATCQKLAQLYTTNFSRFEPFLLSESRDRLPEFYSSQIDAVVQINVDGFIMTEPLVGFKVNTHLGGLKCEEKNTGTLKIENVNHVSKKCSSCKEYIRANMFASHDC